MTVDPAVVSRSGPARGKWRVIRRAVRARLSGLSGPLGYVARAIGWLSDIGTQRYDEDTRRRLKILNLIAYLVVLTNVTYAIQYALKDYQTFQHLVWVNLALAVLVSAVPALHRFNAVAGGVLLVASEWIALTLITGLIGTDSGVHLQFFVGAAAPFVVFGLHRLGLVLATIVSGFLLHLLCAFALPPGADYLMTSPGWQEIAWLVSGLGGIALIAVAIWAGVEHAQRVFFSHNAETSAAPTGERSHTFAARAGVALRKMVAAADALTRPLRRGIGWLAEVGTHGYDEDTRRGLKILNMIAYLISVTTLTYSLQHTFTDYATFKWLIWVNAALAPLAIIVPLSHRISPIAGGLIVVGAEWIALTMITALIGTDSGVHYQFVVAAAAPFVVFGLKRIWLVLATVLSGLLLHVTCAFAFPPDTAIIAAAPNFVDGIYTQAIVTTVGLIAATVWYAFRLAEDARAETDRLLRKILPDQVVARLKLSPGKVIADNHPNTAVLFADIVGFVPLAKSLGPERVVRLLNELVTTFDALAAKHGVEKIKTIGDAYMAVAGVPEPVERPTRRVAALALDMIAATERIKARRGIELSLRIGMASGPVMAGVIGTHKFSYDVWGDTVNLASRLENQSTPGRVMICPTCNAALADDFRLEPCGEIEIKGVGRQPVWFIAGQAGSNDAAN